MASFIWAAGTAKNGSKKSVTNKNNQNPGGAKAAGRRILYCGGAIVELVVQLQLCWTGLDLLLVLLCPRILLLPVSVNHS